MTAAAPMKPEVLAHFGLERDPYGLVAADYWQSPEFRRALMMVDYAVGHDDVIALIGEVGSGKTEALREVIDALGASPERRIRFIRPAHADKSKLTIGHVLEAMLHAFAGDGAMPGSQQKRAFLLRKHLVQAHGAGERVCLLLDEAHRLSGNLLKSLKELHEQSRFASRPALFSVVLVGHRGLVEHYARVARDVHDRLTAGRICLMGEMTPPEITAYVRHRAESAGRPELFDPEAAAAIGRLATSPLQANRICSAVMDAAYLDGAEVIGVAEILGRYPLAELAEMLGLSRGQLAELTGLGKTTVSDALSGGKASGETLSKLENALRGLLKE